MIFPQLCTQPLSNVECVLFYKAPTTPPYYILLHTITYYFIVITLLLHITMDSTYKQALSVQELVQNIKVKIFPALLYCEVDDHNSE